MPHAIDASECAACGACEEECAAGALRMNESELSYVVDPAACTDCADCVAVCPTGAISPPPGAETGDQAP